MTHQSEGLLQVYQNRPQLTIHKMVRILDSDRGLRRLFPVVGAERGRDVRRAAQRSARVQNIHLRRLLDSFMEDEAISRLYRVAPAAKSVHHAFLGGLIEHVLSALRALQDDRGALQEHRSSTCC